MDALGHPAALVALGVFVGFIGSLTGIGGGVLMVPYLVGALGWVHLRAVGTSIAVVLVNAASATLGYARQRRVDFALGALLAAGAIPGTFAGRWLAQSMSGAGFSLAFAGLLLVAAVLLALPPAEGPVGGLAWFRRGWRRSFTDTAGVGHAYEVNPWFGLLASVVVGAASTLFGVGGGFLHVPILILLYGVPPHVATATSAFALAITSVVGTAQYAVPAMHIDVPAAIYLGLGAIVGAHAGSAAAPRVAPRGLRLLLAVVLAAVAAAMAIGTFTRPPGRV